MDSMSDKMQSAFPPTYEDGVWDQGYDAGAAAERARLLPVLVECEERIREWCNYCGGDRGTCDNAPGVCPARAARKAAEGAELEKDRK